MHSGGYREDWQIVFTVRSVYVHAPCMQMPAEWHMPVDGLRDYLLLYAIYQRKAFIRELV